MRYIVSTFRDAGLEAKWKKTRAGKPYISARLPGEKVWWYVNSAMWMAMQSRGIMQGYKDSVLLGDILSIKI